MTDRSDRLKNHLRDSEEDSLSAYLEKAEKEAIAESPPKSRPLKNLVLIALIVFVGVFLFRGTSNISLNPFNLISQTVLMAPQPSDDLLNRMNSRMIEMGYTDLDHEDLRDLRNDGVTATYISNLRALGYTDLTLENAVTLAKANASSAFIAMMIELGYTLDVEDIVMLRGAGVTAHFTSNIHDLGYRDVSLEQLVRMRRIGVTPELVKELQAERGENIPMEDIIRHRISNQ